MLRAVLSLPQVSEGDVAVRPHPLAGEGGGEGGGSQTKTPFALSLSKDEQPPTKCPVHPSTRSGRTEYLSAPSPPPLSHKGRGEFWRSISPK
jgi:hypothetical protein